MSKGIGILTVLIGLSVIASIIYDFPVSPEMAKTFVGIILIMFGIIEIKERRLA